MTALSAALIATVAALTGCGGAKQAAPAAQAPEVSVVTVQRASVPVTTELPGRTSAYKLVALQFDNGTATELALRQSEGVVEQAQANNTAYVRVRAQAENGLVLLIGQPLPAELAPPAGLGKQVLLTDIPAELPSDLLASPRYPAG